MESKTNNMSIRNEVKTVEPTTDAFRSSAPILNRHIDGSNIKPMSIKDRIRAMNLEPAPTATPKLTTSFSYKIPISPSKSVASAPGVYRARKSPSRFQLSSATSDFSADCNSPRISYSNFDQIAHMTRSTLSDSGGNDQRQPTSGAALWKKRCAVILPSTDERDDGSSVICKNNTTLSSPSSLSTDMDLHSLKILQHPSSKSYNDNVSSSTNKVALFWKLKDSRATATSSTASSTSTFGTPKQKIRTTFQSVHSLIKNDNLEKDDDNIKHNEGHQLQVSALTHVVSPSSANSTVSAPYLTLPMDTTTAASAVSFWRRRRAATNVDANANKNNRDITPIYTQTTSAPIHNNGDIHANNCTKTQTRSRLFFNDKDKCGDSMDSALSDLKNSDRGRLDLVGLREARPEGVSIADATTLALMTQMSDSDTAPHHNAEQIPGRRAAIPNLKPLWRHIQTVTKKASDEKKLLARSNVCCGKIVTELSEDVEFSESVTSTVTSYESAASARLGTDEPSLQPVPVDTVNMLPSSGLSFEVTPLPPILTNPSAPASPQTSLSYICNNLVPKTPGTLSAETPSTFVIPSLKPVARSKGELKSVDTCAIEEENASTRSSILNAPPVQQQQKMQASTKLPSPWCLATQTATSTPSLQKTQISSYYLAEGRNRATVSLSLPSHRPFTQLLKSQLETDHSQDYDCPEKPNFSTSTNPVPYSLGFKPGLADARFSTLPEIVNELKLDTSKGSEGSVAGSICRDPSRWSRHLRQHEKHTREHEQVDTPDSSNNSVHEKKDSTMHFSRSSSGLCNKPNITSTITTTMMPHSKQDGQKNVNWALTPQTMSFQGSRVVASDFLMKVQKNKFFAKSKKTKVSEKRPCDRISGSDKYDEHTPAVQKENKKSEICSETTCKEACAHEPSRVSDVSMPRVCTPRTFCEVDSQRQHEPQAAKRYHSFRSKETTPQEQAASCEDEKESKGRSLQSSCIPFPSNEMATEFIPDGLAKKKIQHTKQTVYIDNDLCEVLENSAMLDTLTVLQAERSDETSTVSTAKTNNCSPKNVGRILKLPPPDAKELINNETLQDWKSDEVVASNTSAMRSEVLKEMLDRQRKIHMQKEKVIQRKAVEPFCRLTPATPSSFDVDSSRCPVAGKVSLSSSPTTLTDDCLNRSKRKRHFEDLVALLSISDDDHGNCIPASSMLLPVSPPSIVRSTHCEHVDSVTDPAANQALTEEEADRELKSSSISFESGVYYRALPHRITSDSPTYPQSNESSQFVGKLQGDAGFLKDEYAPEPKDIFKPTDQDMTMLVDLNNIKGNAQLENTEESMVKPLAGTPELTTSPGQTNQTTSKTANRNSSLKKAIHHKSGESHVDSATSEQLTCSRVFEPVIPLSARTSENFALDREEGIDNQSASSNKQNSPRATSLSGAVPAASCDSGMQDQACSRLKQSCNCVNTPFRKCNSLLWKETTSACRSHDKVAPISDRTPVISNKKLCGEAQLIDPHLDFLSVSRKDTSKDDRQRHLTRTIESPTGTRLHSHHSLGKFSSLLAPSTRNDNSSATETYSLLSLRATRVLKGRRRRRNAATGTISMAQDVDSAIDLAPNMSDNADASTSNIKKVGHGTFNKPFSEPDTWVPQKLPTSIDWPSDDILEMARNRSRNVQNMQKNNQFDSPSSSFLDSPHDEYNNENELVGFGSKAQSDSSKVSIHESSPLSSTEGDFEFATNYENDCKPLTEVFIFESPSLQYQSLAYHLNAKSSSSSLSVNEVSFDSAPQTYLPQRHANSEVEEQDSDLVMWISNAYKDLADKLDWGSLGTNDFAKTYATEPGLLACGDDDNSESYSPVRIFQGNDYGYIEPEETMAIEVEYLEDGFYEKDSFLDSYDVGNDEVDLATPYDFPAHSKDVHPQGKKEKRARSSGKKTAVDDRDMFCSQARSSAPKTKHRNRYQN